MRVLHLGRKFIRAHAEYDAFCDRHTVVNLEVAGTPRAEVIERLRKVVKQQGPFEACLAYSVHELAPLGEDLLGCLCPDLKLLTNSGAGTDIIDIPYFTEHGAFVANTPTAVTKSTADGTALFILSCIKDSTAVVAQAKSAGVWREGLSLVDDPENLTLGIMQALFKGMGKIGQQVSQRMKAFGMTVIYHNRSRLSADEEAMMGVSYASMDDLLSRSDVISLNCPLTPQTKHIINKESISKMKDGVMIVNTARGACIDTDALVEALKSGKVSRAGLAVFETEPEIPEYFKTSDKVMIMPHYLAFTKGTLERLENELLQNVETYAATERPKAAVNEP